MTQCLQCSSPKPFRNLPNKSLICRKKTSTKRLLNLHMSDGIPTANHNTSRESNISLPHNLFLVKLNYFIYKEGIGVIILSPHNTRYNKKKTRQINHLVYITFKKDNQCINTILPNHRYLCKVFPMILLSKS